MRLDRCMKWTGFCTLVALAYIHMQMSIYSLAYQGKAREQKIAKLREQQGVFTHSILTLKSSNNPNLENGT